MGEDEMSGRKEIRFSGSARVLVNQFFPAEQVQSSLRRQNRAKLPIPTEWKYNPANQTLSESGSQFPIAFEAGGNVDLNLCHDNLLKAAYET